MYDRKVVRRRRAALAVFVGPVDRDPDRLLRRVRRRLLPRPPARGAGGVRADRDRRQPRAQAGARLLRLGRRHDRRQGPERGPQEGGPAAARPAGPVGDGPARRRSAARRWSSLRQRELLPAVDGAGHGARDRPLVRRSGTRRSRSTRAPTTACASNQPVIAAGGLIGKLISVTGGTAEVRLITDGESGVSAQVFPAGVSGVVRPEVGNPDDLLLEHVESGRRVTENTLVVTSGFTLVADRVAVPARHPDRPRDQGRPRRARDLPARARQAVRRPAPHRPGPGADAQGRRLSRRRRWEARADDPVGRRLRARRGPAAGGGGPPALGAQPARPSSAAHADLVVLVVAAVAYYGGSVPGCATGFSAGLLLDLLTGDIMGASSLVLTAVGYGVGRFREVRDPSHGLLPVAVGTLATAGWVVGVRGRGADARHRGAREPARAARHDRDRAAERAAGAARVHRLPQAAAPVAGGRPARAAPPPAPAARGRPARARGLEI